MGGRGAHQARVLGDNTATRGAPHPLVESGKDLTLCTPRLPDLREHDPLLQPEAAGREDMEFVPVIPVPVAAQIDVNTRMSRFAPEFTVARVFSVGDPSFDLSVQSDDKAKM